MDDSDLNLVFYQFSFAALSLRERFRILNKKLLDQPTINLNILKSLAMMHDQLCYGISMVNSMFTIQLIPFTAVYVVLMLTTIHFSIVEISYETWPDFIVLILNSYGYFLFTQIIGFALNAGTTTQKEVKKTANIVHNIINQSTDEYLIHLSKIVDDIFSATATC